MVVISFVVVTSLVSVTGVAGARSPVVVNGAKVVIGTAVVTSVVLVMVDDAGGACPHCGGPVTEIETVTPLGRMLDQAIELTVTEVVYQELSRDD